MKTIATVCARGGSVRLPKKNVLDFLGKPLIAHTIEQALNCDFIDDVIVSTDDLEIAEIAKQYGAKAPFIRPSHLATPESGKIPVLMHCIDFLEAQGQKIAKVIDLQPTSPLRNVDDIEKAYKLLTEGVDVIFSIYESNQNPYFNLVEVNNNGYCSLSKSWNNMIVRGQDAPKVYALNGAIYAWNRHAIKRGLWGGKAKGYIMPKERSIDIDDAHDLEISRFLAGR